MDNNNENNTVINAENSQNISENVPINASAAQPPQETAAPKKKNKKPVIIAIAVAAVLFLAILAIILLPKIFKSADDYKSLGDYEKAYTMAKDSDETADIVAENAVAVCSGICMNSLKEPESFTLCEAYYDFEKENVVLTVDLNLTDFYGDPLLSYWLFQFSSKTNKYELFNFYTNLKLEDVSTYGDSKKAEIMVANMGKKLISDTMNSYTLSDDSIKRINALSADNTLSDVSLLNVEYKTATE